MRKQILRPKILLMVLIGFSLLVISSCAAPAYYMGTDEAAVEDVAVDYAPAPEERAAMEATDTDYKTYTNGEVAGESHVRHVIRNGSIELTVSDTREKIRDIHSIAEEAGGVISNSNIYEMREGQYAANLTLRIPENNFSRVMDELETLGKARNIQTGSDDVTMQYVDLESRLNNQKAQEERLIEILEMAETVEDVLEIERELYRVRGEIESMTAQLNRLDDLVSLATIQVNLREEAIPTGELTTGPFEGLWTRIVQTFTGSVNFLLNATSITIIAFSALLPVLILLAFITLIIVLVVRKLSKRKRANTPQSLEKEDSKSEA